MQAMVESSHLCAKGSLCGLLHSLPIFSWEILAQVLIQVILFNEAPEDCKDLRVSRYKQ